MVRGVLSSCVCGNIHPDRVLQASVSSVTFVVKIDNVRPDRDTRAVFNASIDPDDPLSSGPNCI